MGCSHLPNGSRQLLNSSIISKQQLGTGRKASLSRETTSQPRGPVLWCKKLRKTRVQAQTLHLYYSISNPHLPSPTGESSPRRNPETASQCCSAIATGSCAGSSQVRRTWRTILHNSTLTTSNLTDHLQPAATAGGDSAVPGVGSREEARRRSFLEAAAEGRAGAGVEGGISHRLVPCSLQVTHVASQQSSVDVQASPTADNPDEVAEPKCCCLFSQRQSLGSSGRGHCPQQEEKLYPTYACISRPNALLPWVISQSLTQHPRLFWVQKGFVKSLLLPGQDSPYTVVTAQGETPKKLNRLSYSCLVSVKGKKI